MKGWKLLSATTLLNSGFQDIAVKGLLFWHGKIHLVKALFPSWEAAAAALQYHQYHFFGLHFHSSPAA